MYYFTVFFIAVVAFVGGARATTPEETVTWLEGRWAGNGACNEDWIEFKRSFIDWQYREIQIDSGRWLNVTVESNMIGTITVSGKYKESRFEYIVRFLDKDRFFAFEEVTDGPLRSPRRSHYYSRCKSN